MIGAYQSNHVLAGCPSLWVCVALRDRAAVRGRAGVDAVPVLWKVNRQVPAPLFRARRKCLQLPHAHALRALRPLRKKVGLRSAVAVEMRNRSVLSAAAAADAAAAAGR